MLLTLTTILCNSRYVIKKNRRCGSTKSFSIKSIKFRGSIFSLVVNFHNNLVVQAANENVICGFRRYSARWSVAR